MLEDVDSDDLLQYRNKAGAEPLRTDQFEKLGAGGTANQGMSWHATVTKDSDGDFLELDDNGRVVVAVLPHDKTEGSAPEWAFLSTSWAGSTGGLYIAPKVGDEVLIVYPGGSRESQPVITGGIMTAPAGILDAGNPRSDLTWLSSPGGDLQITLDEATGRVELRTSGGLAVRVATKPDIDALAGWAAVHRHDQGGAAPGPTTIPTTTLPLPGPTPDIPPAALGTQTAFLE